jgi:hypothetical protein
MHRINDSRMDGGAGHFTFFLAPIPDIFRGMILQQLKRFLRTSKKISAKILILHLGFSFRTLIFK